MNGLRRRSDGSRRRYNVYALHTGATHVYMVDHNEECCKLAQSVMQQANIDKSRYTIINAEFNDVLKELPNIIKYDYNIGKKCKDLFSNYDFLNKKEHKKSLKDLLVDYNIMIIENDQLKMKVEELTETIYQLADLE